MALRIRNNKDIKGFQIKIDEQTHNIKIAQLADDTILYFNSKNDIAVAMNEIEIVGARFLYYVFVHLFLSENP
jgi:hypothetical protein